VEVASCPSVRPCRRVARIELPSVRGSRVKKNTRCRREQASHIIIVPGPDAYSDGSRRRNEDRWIGRRPPQTPYSTSSTQMVYSTGAKTTAAPATEMGERGSNNASFTSSIVRPDGREGTRFVSHIKARSKTKLMSLPLLVVLCSALSDASTALLQLLGRRDGSRSIRLSPMSVRSPEQTRVGPYASCTRTTDRFSHGRRL
jgi:hypothetical protein